MAVLCFLFGNRDTPESAEPLIAAEIERIYLGCKHTEVQFIVGNYGSFDRMAIGVLRRLKQKYPRMVVNLLTPWHPAERPVDTPQGFDGQFYPPIENVPRQLAIVKANEYVVDISAFAICFVAHSGNTRRLLELAQRKRVAVFNIADKLTDAAAQ